MKILSIAYYTLKRNLRSRTVLANYLLLPIVLIFILGNALGGIYSTTNLDKTKTGYVNMDKGELSGYFDNYLENKQIKDLLDITKVSSIDEGKKLIEQRKISALIVVNEDYSNSIKNGNKGKIDVYGKQYSDFRLSIVQSIVESFIDRGNANQAMLKTGESNLKYEEYKNIDEIPISQTGKKPSAIDYYAVTMLTMILMYTFHYGSSYIGELYYDEIGKRIKGMPIKPIESLVGVILGVIFSVFLQVIILILFSKYVYKANWGNNIGMIIFIAMSLGILGITLGGMVSILVGDEDKANGILGILVPIFTFFGGGYAQIVTDNPFFSKIMYLSPNYLAHNAFFNTIYGGPISMNVQYMGTGGCIATIWGIAIVMLLITAVVGRRKLS